LVSISSKDSLASGVGWEFGLFGLAMEGYGLILGYAD